MVCPFFCSFIRRGLHDLLREGVIVTNNEMQKTK
jgi:hypothetical protein